MTAKLPLALAFGLLLIPAAAMAQEEQPTMVRALYYWCDQSKESRADEIVNQSIAPVYDRLLSAGDISGWGYLVHSVGGKWRRAAYWAAPSMDALLDATEKLVAELPEETMAEFNAICPGHDDYIWRSVGGSSGVEIPQERAAAGLSTYYQCDVNREGRADDIVTEAFAPVLDRHVAAGDINGWSWLAHAWGGKMRRLLVFDGGPDHKTLLNGFASSFQDVGAEAGGAVREFFEICPVHEDYFWNIVHSKP